MLSQNSQMKGLGNVWPTVGAVEKLSKLFIITSGGFTQHLRSDTGNHFTYFDGN